MFLRINKEHLLKKIGITTLAAAIALSGGLTVLPASPAFAQSGSRLCGYSAYMPKGVIGILFEARQDDASYSLQCDEAVKSAWSKIQANAQLKKLTWTKHYKETCESVGGMFVSSNSPVDMCDKMEAGQGYQVTMSVPTNTTTYEQK